MIQDIGEDETLRAAEAEFEVRLELYRKLGHDREEAVRWVVDAGGPLSSPVLDVGTGKGLLAVELARRGLAVTSVDPCRRDQALAARRAERSGCAAAISFVTGTIEAIGAAEGAFSAAAMLDVLHHFDAGEPTLARIGELVGPGGRLLIAEFSEAGFEVVSRAHHAEGHEHKRGPVDMRRARDVLISRGWLVDHEAAGYLHEVVVFCRAARVARGD